MTDTETKLITKAQPILEALDAFPDALLAVDRDYRLAYLNFGATRMLGTDSESALGKTIWEVAPHFFTYEVRSLLEEAWSNGLPIHFEENCRGGTIWCEIHAYPNSEKMTLFLRDVTDRKQTIESLECFAVFTRRSPYPVVQINHEGRIILKNDAMTKAARELRISEEQLLPEGYAELARLCLEDGNTRSNLERIVEDRTFLWALVPSIDAAVVQGYATEITERLQLEEQVRQSQKVESIGRLAGGIAHDFNNYLTVIQGYCQLLDMEDSISQQGKEFLREIIETAEKAAKLTKQILTFSRRQVVRPKILNLGEMVLNFVEFIRPLLGEAITIHFIEDPDLPPIQADEHMIEQIIMNLATNARDAMPNGGTLTISLSCVNYRPGSLVVRQGKTVDGRFICITVSDQGTGMDEATLKQIFEPFFTTKDVGRGTGLGLSVVDAIVKQNEGWIEVSSQLGEGTTFMVYLPVAEENSSIQTKVQEGKPIEVIVGNGETVLVVEDQTNLLKLIESTLSKKGYNVFCASNGPEAVQVWQKNKNKIHLVITDMMMPGGMTGKDVGQRITSENPCIPVIYMSGYSVELLKQPLYPNVRFLQKPFNPEKLVRMVGEALNTPEKRADSLKQKKVSGV